MTRRQKTAVVLERLREVIPRPETELEHINPFQLLVAVVLSAQCTDERVNQVTPALFEAYPTAEAMARAEPTDVLPYIRSVTYPNQKSRALVAAAREIVARFGGAVPATREELRTLPGVGQKSANVIVAVAFEQPAIAVDTHVFRVANRIGIVKDAPTPEAVEAGLLRVVRRDDWIDAHHLLILHGRYTCQARRPACERCPLSAPVSDSAPRDGARAPRAGAERPLCDYFAALQRLPAPMAGLDGKRGRYYGRASGRYFDEPAFRVDRSGIEQLADPRTGSTDVYDARTGESTRKVRDYRVGRGSRK